jgi:hypothetical protein
MLYDHPFAFVVASGLTTVSSIFLLEKLKHPTMSMSSRVMHTRVYSQGIIVSILCGTMIFHDYMSRRGHFLPEGVPRPISQKEEEAKKFRLSTVHVDHSSKPVQH